MRRLMIPALAAATLLAACGGSSKESASTGAPVATPVAEAPATSAPTTAAPATDAPTTAAPATDAPTTVAVTEAAAPSDPSSTDAVVSTDAPLPTDVGGSTSGDFSFSGAGSGPYCDFVRSTNDAAFGEAFSATDPVAAKEQMGEVKKLMEQAVSTAPDEIEADAKVVAGFFDKIIAAYDKYEYDVTKLAAAVAKGEAPELGALFGGAPMDPAFEKASERLAAYDEQICGLAS